MRWGSKPVPRPMHISPPPPCFSPPFLNFNQRASGRACSGKTYACFCPSQHCLNIEEHELSGLYFMNINLVLKESAAEINV
jgi:hypothetical protein